VFAPGSPFGVPRHGFSRRFTSAAWVDPERGKRSRTSKCRYVRGGIVLLRFSTDTHAHVMMITTCAVQGIDYTRGDSELSDAVVALPRSKWQQRLTSAAPLAVVALLGIATGVLVNFVLSVTSAIETWKVGLMKRLLESSGSGVFLTWVRAWAAWTGIGLVLALGASICVLIAPAVRSSGIPLLLAFLNGAGPPSQASPLAPSGKKLQPFGFRTLVAKCVGTILAVSSGLFLGPEGPLIHMGAIVGHLSHCLAWSHMSRRTADQIRAKQEGRIVRPRGETLAAVAHLTTRYGPRRGSVSFSQLMRKSMEPSGPASPVPTATADAAGDKDDCGDDGHHRRHPSCLRAPTPASIDSDPGCAAQLRWRHAPSPRFSRRQKNLHSHDLRDMVTASGGFDWLPGLGSRNEQARDMAAVAAGAAIAAAFSAPLAGVMFVVEEASSKVTLRLLEWGFVACASAFFVTWAIRDTPPGDGTLCCCVGLGWKARGVVL